MEFEEMNINRETADLAVAEASDKGRPSLDAHLLRGDEAFEAFGSSKDGISSDEAKSRIDRYGPNQLQERKKTSAWMRLLLEHGTMRPRDVLAPAIGYARDGYPLAHRAAESIHAIASLFRSDWHHSAAVWLPGDRAPMPGDRVAYPPRLCLPPPAEGRVTGSEPRWRRRGTSGSARRRRRRRGPCRCPAPRVGRRPGPVARRASRDPRPSSPWPNRR